MTQLGLLVSLFIAGCGPEAPPIAIDPHPLAASVVVVYNTNAADAKAIADHYVKARGVPASNIVPIKTTNDEDVPKADYRTAIVEPVAKAINSLKSRVDYIVLIRGVPLRVGHQYGPSVDASLMIDAHPSRSLDWMTPPKRDGNSIQIDPEEIRKYANPYGGMQEKFDSDKFKMYLCTRLDGYTVADAKALVDRSVQAKASTGLFLLDSSPERTGGGYGAVQQWMKPAESALTARGMRVEHETSRLFIGDKSDIMGYASWGSNDPAFAPSLYRSLRFLPGSIAETFVSTSGRTFRKTTGGQSLVADLVAQGVTGVKGYVSEPYTFALCRVDILFDRYASGRNLAESFWSATPLLKWKDVVIGDPLCAPFAKASVPSNGAGRNEAL